MWKKTALISSILIAISAMHFSAIGKEFDLHLIHRELFFIPVLLGSFWFGLRAGMFLAVIVSLLYAPLLFVHEQHLNFGFLIYAQVILYFGIAVLFGWLSDSRAKQEAEVRKRNEAASIGRAAAALAFEIKDVADSIKHIVQKSDKEAYSNKQFSFEVQRLEKLFQTLTKYHDEQDQLSLSVDLADIVNTAITKTRSLAQDNKISVTIEKCEEKCTTTAWTESMENTLVGLIENGIEASTPNNSVTINIGKKNDHCIIEIINDGTIARDIEDKLFKPFFTTKKLGHGLTLAGGKKILRDHGGNLSYAPLPGKTRFEMIIPRDSVHHSIEELIESHTAAPDQQQQ